MSNAISSFYVDGVHSPLSNFYQFQMHIDGIPFATIEHYFQAMKTTNMEERRAIAEAESPGIAKRIGRKCSLRGDWEAVKLQVMRYALYHKFERNNEMGKYLLDTGDALLVEGNSWGDRYWGAVDGKGENWLGYLLMARRAELRFYGESNE